MATIFDQVQETVEPQSKVLAKQVVRISKQTGNMLKTRYARSFYTLWGKEDSRRTIEEVQAIVDEWGTNAAAIFQVSSDTQAFIASIDDEYVPLVPPYTATPNVDGTITIS